MKNNSQRAKLAILLIWIILGLEIALIIDGFVQHRMFVDILNDVDVSDAKINLTDTLQNILLLIYTFVYIISAVTFIQWFRRAYFNLHTHVSNLEYTEGWAAGSWFIPILNLFRPYYIMNELYRETNNLLSKKLDSFDQQLNATVVGIWWFLWIGSTFLNQMATKANLKANSVEAFIECTELSILSSLMSIPLCFIAIKLIKDYSKIEPLLFQLKNTSDNDSADDLTNLELSDDEDILDAFQ